MRVLPLRAFVATVTTVTGQTYTTTIHAATVTAAETPTDPTIARIVVRSELR